MSSLALNLPRHNPRAFLLIAVVVWFAIYKTLEPLSHLLVGALPLEAGSHLYDALQFFFYDTRKVLLLLAGAVMVMMTDNARFSPQRTRAL